MNHPKTRFVAALLAVGCAVAAAASEPPPGAREGIDEAFRQLSAADPNDRAAAREALIAKGDEAVPRLEELAENTSDPQARKGAAAVLKEIRARSTTLASLITLDVKDASPEEVFREIARQAGTEVILGQEQLWEKLEQKTVTLKVNRQPFWSVMRDLVPQCGLWLRDHSRFDQGPPQTGLRLTLGTKPMTAGPTYMSGPFMVTATTVKETREIDLTQPEQRKPANTHILAVVHVEPKVRLLGHHYTPQVDEFVDDAGHSLISDVPGYPVRFDATPSGIRFTAVIPVSDVEGRTKRIARLKGSIRAILQTRSEQMEVPDVVNAKGWTGQKGHWQLSVEDVVKVGENHYRLKLSGSRGLPPDRQQRPPPGQQQEWWPSVDGRGLWVVDAAGRYQETRTGAGSGSWNRWQFDFDLSVRGEPAKGPLTLVWEFPVEWTEIRIPFEFADIPLP